jgi:hypothetical protein
MVTLTELQTLPVEGHELGLPPLATPRLIGREWLRGNRLMAELETRKAGLSREGEPSRLGPKRTGST